MKNKRTVLVTGAAGFIGSNLTRKLLTHGYNVNLILKKSTDTTRIKDLLRRVEVYESDLLNEDKIARVVGQINPTYILHLSTYSEYRERNDWRAMVDNNVVGTLNLLLAAQKVNYKVFVNTGSSSEYGFKNKPMREDDLLEPTGPYAVSKASASLLCRAFAAQFNKPILTIRPFSVYGPHEDESRLIPTIVNSVIRGTSIKLTDTLSRRDFIYVEDLIDIYVKSIECSVHFSGEILNAGTGKEYTNEEVVRALFRVSGKKVKVEKGAFSSRAWDAPHWRASTSKIKRYLGWKPKFSLESGLKETYSWFENEKI